MHLFRRKNVYYARLRIPQDIINFFPKYEIVRSLRCTKYRQAKSLFNCFTGRLERLFLMIRSNTLTDDMIKVFVDDIVNNSVFLHDRSRSKMPVTEDSELQSQISNSYDSLDNTIFAIPDRYDMFIKALEAEQSDNKRALAMNKSTSSNEVVGYARLLALTNRVTLDADSPEYLHVCNEILKGLIRVDSIVIEHLKGNFETEYDIEQRRKAASHSLKTVIAAYITDTGKGDRKRKEKAEKILACFQYESKKDDLILSEIDRNLTRKVAERLLKYPLHRNLKYKGKTLDEIYKMAGVRYPAISTQREELFFLSSLYSFAIRDFDGLSRNFAEGLAEKMVPEDKRKDSEYRDIFRTEDIQEIVRELCRRKKKGEFKNNPHLLWIPLIAFFQGPRVNEICQLHIADLGEIDGIWCMSINDDGDKSVKNSNSRRVNPIHPTLLDLGLIRFWQSQKDKG